MARARAAGFTLPRRAERGFTLIELLVVLAILGLALAVVMPRLEGSSETIALRAAAVELRGVLRAARSTAITANRDLLFAIDPAGHGYALDGQPHGFRSGGFTSHVLHVEPAARILFYATGATSGGRLTIRGRRDERSVVVDGIAGQVAIVQ